MALKYRGVTHSMQCDCALHDAGKISVDPTGTAGLRSKYRAALAMKWRSVRALTRRMLIDQDLLQLSSVGLLRIDSPALQMGSTKIQMFQRWFDYVLSQTLLNGDGSWMRSHVAQAYDAGVTYARTLVGTADRPNIARERESALLQLAIVELQGVMEAASQQAVRAVAGGLLAGDKASSIMRQVWLVIDRVGIERSKLLADLITVKSFNDAALDVFESVGVQQVGLVPELKTIPLRVNDARKKGPGSRVSRTRIPSPRTIQRIKAVEREVEKLRRVRVRTAGDNKVCAICERISKGGPYSINKARALIPAHPNCRCTFVPADDRRFSRDSEIAAQS